EMVVRWKPNGIRTFVNKAYCEAYGITEELAIGTSFFALIADEDHQDVRERIANLSPENPVSTGIHKITRPDGTRGWNEWTDRAFFDHRGKIKELQSTGRDISKLMESNMIFQDMLDKCLVGVYIIVGGKVVMVNREFCRIFGYEQAEISSLDLKNLVHPDYHTLIEEKIQKRLDGTAENRRYEFVAVRKDQQQRWVEVLGSKTLYGGKEAIIGTVQDITDRKGNLEELISSRAKLETILEHTRNQYFLVDLNFKIISYNKAAEDYANLEYSHRTLDQDSILSFIRPEKQEAFINMIEEVKSGKVVTYVREDKGIRNRWFEISLIPVKTGKKVTAFVLSGEDITTKKMAEAELLSRIELFKDLSFITSHELRTEYARLHALLGSIKDIGAFNPYVQKLITESQSSFKKLNESIFKLNNKINFSHRTFMGTILQMPEIDEIVLVEDDEIISTVHESLIQSFTEVDKILHYNNADDSMDYLKANRDRDFLVFLDLSMPGKSGWDFLDELNELDLNVIVVILSGSIDLNDRIRAADYPQVREFLSKPLTREIVQKIFDQMTTPV
ncbi:MAG: PAS domain S-box protein, partial [Bacteroidetes bacterium]|nr:PAS domain S-box protein [Bacteroidota bacterium]